jgi:hypothetical protein
MTRGSGGMSKLPGELRPGKAAGTSCPTSHGPRGAVGRASSPLRELVGHGEERVFFLEILEFCCCKSFFRKTFYPKSFMFVDKIFLKRNLTNVFINLVFQKSFSFC